MTRSWTLLVLSAVASEWFWTNFPCAVRDRPSFGNLFLPKIVICAKSVNTGLRSNLRHHQIFGADRHSLLPFHRAERTPVVQPECQKFFLFAATGKSMSCATVTYMCQPHMRNTITARAAVRVKTSVTHIAPAFASQVTSTSHCQEPKELQRSDVDWSPHPVWS